jgi:hypothetical protein
VKINQRNGENSLDSRENRHGWNFIESEECNGEGSGHD